MDIAAHIAGASAAVRAVDGMLGALDTIATGVDDAPRVFGRGRALEQVADGFAPQLDALRELRRTEPLRTPLKDAIDGALVSLEGVESTLRRGDTGPVRSAIEGARSAVAGIRTAGDQELSALNARETWRTPDAALAAARGVLARGYDAMQDHDWRTLQSIARLDDEMRPAGLELASGGSSFADQLGEVAGHVTAGRTINAEWHGWSVLDAFAARQQHTTRATAQARLVEFLETPSANRTRQDWHDLAGLVQLPDGIRPTGLDGFAASRHARAADIAKVGEMVRAGATVSSSWDGYSILGDLAARHRFPTKDAATAEYIRILDQGYTAMQPDDWRTLQSLTRLEDLRPTGLEDDPATLATQLGEVAGHVQGHATVNKDWNGWVQLDRLVARNRYATRELAEARLATLVETPRSERTRQFWHELAGIADLPDNLRPAGLEPLRASEHGTPKVLAAAGEQVHQGQTLNANWIGLTTLEDLRTAHAYPTQAAAASEATRLLAKGYSAMRPDDWRTLQAIARLRDELRPHGLAFEGDNATLATQLGEVADHVAATRNVNRDWKGWQVLDAYLARQRHATRDAADARLSALLEIPGSARTREQWHEIAGLALLPDELRPPRLDALRASENATPLHIARVGEMVHQRAAVSAGWQGHVILDGIVTSTRYPTREAATAGAIELLGDGYSAMQPDDWRALAAIARLGDDARPIGLRYDTDDADLATHLTKVAGHVASNSTVNKDWSGWVRLDAFRAANSSATAESIVARLEALARLDKSDLTRDQLHEVAGLLQLGDDLRPTWFGARNHAEPSDFARVGELRHQRANINEMWAGFKALKEWGDQARIDQAIASAGGDATAWVDQLVATSGSSTEARDTLARVAALRPDLLPHSMDPIVRLRTLALAPEFAAEQLVRTGSTPKAWLLDVQETSRRIDIERAPQLREMRDRILTRIDANLPRMEATSGNAFTDLADIGAIGTDAATLTKFLDVMTPAPQPAVAGTGVAIDTGTGATPAAGSAAETLNW